MPTFSTPRPIDLAINIQVGRIDVIASDRSDTVVTLKPSSSRPNDRRGVDETKVTFDDERLSIIGPKAKISWIGPNSGDSVDVTIELPADSRLTAELAVGNIHTSGLLGATRIKSSTGSVGLDAVGDAEVTAAYGQIKIGRITGEALLKSSYGGVVIGTSTGDVEAKLSYGDLTIATAMGSVTATTAFGGVRLSDVSSGSVQVDSGFGEVSIGVRPGVAAWLDLSSKEGRVRNDLAAEAAPDASEQTVSIRVRTGNGDITIQRATN
jgi:DUF4097 and DUF4098 domain-containing protein YvlB